MSEIVETNSNFPRLNPDEKKAFKGNIQELVNSLDRIDAENDLIKNIAEVAEEKYGVPKADTKRIGKMIHKRNVEEKRKESEDLFDFIDTTLEDML